MSPVPTVMGGDAAAAHWQVGDRRDLGVRTLISELGRIIRRGDL